MPSLLLIVFLVELATYLVNTIGAATINNLLWNVLNSFPTEFSRRVAEQRKLQKEYLQCRKELNATSSQDEFAKWAKLRRTHDKLLEQLEKHKSSLDSQRARFDTYATGVRMLLTRAPQIILPLWHARTPVFWLPPGLLPWWAEALLALPRAPRGSVSVLSWQMACAAVAGMVGEGAGAVLAVVLGRVDAAKGNTLKKTRAGGATQQQVPVPAAGGPGTVSGGGGDEKTE